MTMNEVSIQIPTVLSPGEIWFSINLGLVSNLAELFTALTSLGFTPVIAHKRMSDGIEVHVLLHHEKRESLPYPPHELFEKEQRVLADLINPNAMSFSCGLTRRQPVAA